MRWKRRYQDAIDLAAINQRHIEWLQKEMNRLRDDRLEWFLITRRFAYVGKAEWGKEKWEEVFDDYLRLRGRLEDPRG